MQWIRVAGLERRGDIIPVISGEVLGAFTRWVAMKNGTIVSANDWNVFAWPCAT